MPGLLRIKGRIDLDQFWPDGSADADTSKIKVDVTRESFSFAADGRRFRTTRVFDKAVVVGAKRAPLIDSKMRITVRLQGIDATELHYKAPALSSKRKDITPLTRAAFNDWNRTERRQYWAETATEALARKLRRYGTGSIPCVVYSYVEHPYEVVDTYGRVVGNLHVGKRGDVDINLWLAAQGWVFPAYYSSMSVAEIEALDAACAKGRKKPRVWRALSDDTGKFKSTLLYREHGPSDPANDQGPVVMPKLFRRQLAYHAEKAAKISSGTFAELLASRPDECYLTAEFLRDGPHAAKTYRLHEFMKGRRFTRKPQELVFREKFSSLNDPSGRRIDAF